MAAHVLAIDLGSTGVKVAVVDADGRVCSGAGEVFPLIVVPGGTCVPWPSSPTKMVWLQ